MARIVIETLCEHGRAEGCPFHDPVCRSNRPCLATCCPGGSRRVLDPGSFVLIEKVDGEWPEWLLDDLEGRLAANIAEILDALAAGSEQTGGES